MKFLNKLQKLVKDNTIVAIIGLIVVIIAVMSYSNQKFSFINGMSNADGAMAAAAAPTTSDGGGIVGAGPDEGEDAYASAEGMQTSQIPSQNGTKAVNNPKDLLPKDGNSGWGGSNPSGGGDLAGINLLSAGHLAGVNTVGSSMRNPNLQQRPEPANPRGDTGPWNGSTMETDVYAQRDV
jgi:hypothetical protein